MKTISTQAIALLVIFHLCSLVYAFSGTVNSFPRKTRWKSMRMMFSGIVEVGKVVKDLQIVNIMILI